jgi:soluble lytic murein transglycosylase-like protein
MLARRIRTCAVVLTGLLAGGCDIVPAARTTAAPGPAHAAAAASETDASSAAGNEATMASSFAAAPASAASGAGKPVLWGYVDGAGVAHFATHQVDAHYLQVLRESAGPRVTGKTQGPESLLTWLEFSPDVKAVQPWVAEAAAQNGLDSELLQAVIAVESGYNAKAVSPRGAVGLMQLTPETADRYATPEERQQPAAQRMLDARTNIRTGARMLADLTRRYGGIDIALAAWNAGEGNVRRAGGRMPEIAETEAHVHMVLELYWALLQRNLPHRAHGVVIADTRTPG